jgi:hypothetical protein
VKPIVGIYIRMPVSELERLRANPDLLPLYDPRVPLADGRGLDLGRAWEELGVFLDGGVKLPDHGPTVGQIALPNTDGRAAWSYVEPERAGEWADELAQMSRKQFNEAYEVDPEDTQDSLPDARTAGWGDRAAYLYGKLRALAKHYADAAADGDAILIRIGERM